MKSKKYLNDLNVWETKQTLGDSKVYTLYNIPNKFFKTQQENINISITKQ